MKMVKRLFVGGPWHGKLEEVNSERQELDVYGTNYQLGLCKLGSVQFQAFIIPGSFVALDEAVVIALGIEGAQVERRRLEDL